MTTAAHYRLTSDEFLTINSKLTDAQLRVYLYYKTLDPFGDRKVEVCTKAIAEILDLKQRTVQRALNKLCDLGLLIWEKAKSFVRRSVDRLGDLQIAQAIVGSSKRSEDRERQLELNLEADSTTPQSSSILFKLDHDLEQENFGDIEDNNEISAEEAIAEIGKAFGDFDESDLDDYREEDFEGEFEELTDDMIAKKDWDKPDPDLDDQSDLEPDIEYDFVPEKPKTGIEGKPSRAAVEDFVLKTLNKTFPNAARRAAYFSKFDSKSWKKWETDYKASLMPKAPYKPYIPEKVEVASPDSPVAQSAIAQIKAKLGIKRWN